MVTSSINISKNVILNMVSRLEGIDGNGINGSEGGHWRGLPNLAN